LYEVQSGEPEGLSIPSFLTECNKQSFFWKISSY